MGAGIGGLTAAHALGRVGYDVTVFERAPRLWEVGAGIQVYVHAVRALDQLGLARSIADVGLNVEEYVFRSWRGDVLATMPVGEVARHYAIPAPILLRRQELISALGDPLEDRIRFDADCVGFDQDADGVTLRMSDGSEERGALLVGADGAGSSIRKALLPDCSLKPSGLQCLRGLTVGSGPLVPPGMYRMTIGPGRRLGSSGTADWCDWYVIVTDLVADGAAGGLKDQALRFVDGFPSDVLELVQATDETSIFRYDIQPLSPLEHWVEGRVTLIGDAAHATSPDLGQGASQAVLDAVALGESLASSALTGTDVAAALRGFERRRKPRVMEYLARVQKIGAPMNWANPVAWRARDQVMKRVMPKAGQRDLHKEFVEI